MQESVTSRRPVMFKFLGEGEVYRLSRGYLFNQDHPKVKIRWKWGGVSETPKDIN